MQERSNLCTTETGSTKMTLLHQCVCKLSKISIPESCLKLSMEDGDQVDAFLGQVRIFMCLLSSIFIHMFRLDWRSNSLMPNNISYRPHSPLAILVSPVTHLSILILILYGEKTMAASWRRVGHDSIIFVALRDLGLLSRDGGSKCNLTFER